MSSYYKLILNYWQQGGLLLLPILVVCFFIWFNVFSILLRLKKFKYKKDKEEVRLHNMVRDISENNKRLSSDRDFLSLVYNKILFCKNPSEMENTFSEIYEENIAPFNMEVNLISALVTAAPLLGLLGTVWGMVETFDLLSISRDFSSKMISRGISKALITTQFGLIVATPAIFAVTIIKRQLTHLEVRFTQIRFHFINQLMGN